METIESIAAWQDATFGPVQSRARSIARANEELAELIRAWTSNEPPEKIIAEAADVVIVLCALAWMMRAKDEEVSLDFLGDGIIQPRHAVPAMAKCMAFALNQVTEDIIPFSLHVTVMYIMSYAKGLVAALGGKLQDAVDAKMVINRARQWKHDGTGHAYHMKENDDAV